MVFCGMLVITFVRSIGMTFCLRIGTGLAVKLGRVIRLAVRLGRVIRLAVRLGRVTRLAV